MQHLIRQEQFEMEVLNRLNNRRLLDYLVFIGGTMLRLCYGLDRYSLDLDFWMLKKPPGGFKSLFSKIKNCLAGEYKINDAADKYYTMLFEISSVKYPQHLKIEIRKEIRTTNVIRSIGYSTHSDIQVLLNTVPPEEFMKFKINAFIDRVEIKDCFDMEFLVKKGILLPNPGNKEMEEKLQKVVALIEKLPASDYKIKLGSLLSKENRQYYSANNFRILKMAITSLLY